MILIWINDSRNIWSEQNYCCYSYCNQFILHKQNITAISVLNFRWVESRMLPCMAGWGFCCLPINLWTSLLLMFFTFSITKNKIKRKRKAELLWMYIPMLLLCHDLFLEEKYIINGRSSIQHQYADKCMHKHGHASASLHMFSVGLVVMSFSANVIYIYPPSLYFSAFWSFFSMKGFPGRQV